ncbi:MAG: hypothetical protein M1816_002758 [Peltula sp. TS41687]|nr:MAG: hypothetical protein M1816_002758 [Peltula sp. TS41687]
MDRFLISWFDAAKFPTNLIGSGAYDHSLQKYVGRLNDHQNRLFCDEPNAAVDVWELEDQGRGGVPPQSSSKSSWPATDQSIYLTEFQAECIRTAEQVKNKLRFGSPQIKDPLCRFIFVRAPNSRAQLNTTREMFVLLLTYHQVMPAYLDFIFPFGEQLYPQDFYFSGFRHENRLSQVDRGFSVPELGRSGRGLQICYSLKSVEPLKGEWPWSIRQTAVYHSFDIVTGRTTWIIVKANGLMKSRITTATRSGQYPGMKSFQSISGAFAASLETHLIICDWAGENWRWYINFLEEEFQSKTRHALLVNVDRAPSPVPEKLARAKTALQVKRPSIPPFARVFSLNLSKSPSTTPDRAPARPAPDIVLDKSPGSFDQSSFSFTDLQGIQSLEEKANNTLLVLEMNANVLSEMQQEYRAIAESEDWPDELRLGCKGDTSRFKRRVSNVINDLKMQRSRLETLLRLLGQRKSLLYGILDYRNMEASKHLSQKAQQSTDKMEKMTQKMHEIAKKTERETVSMKIITLVTLFFLPGTFISTLMSTDIVRFPKPDSGKPQRTVSFAALQLFMAISIPLMFLSFVAWWGVYKWVNRKITVRGDDSGSEV